MLTFLIRSAISQSRSCPIVLMMLGGSRSRLNPHLKLWKCQESNPWPRDNIIIKQVIHNNRFDINDVVTLFLVLSTGQNGTLDILLLFLHCGGTLRWYYSYARAAFFFLSIKKYHQSKNVFSGCSLQIYLRTKSWKEKV